MQSLVPTNVFDDAKVLHNTYRKLTIVIQGVPKRKHGKPHESNKIGRVEAKRALKQLNRDLLEKLTPEILRQVIVLEWSEGPLVAMGKALVSRQIWRLGSFSVVAAKRLAHLLIQVTMLYAPPEGVIRNAEDTVKVAKASDRCYDFLLYSVMGIEHPYESEALERSPLPSPRLMFGFVEQLIHASKRGDRTAHEYLRLFYRALYAWRFDLQPVAADEYSPVHEQQWNQTLRVASGERHPSDISPLPLPLKCANTYYPCLAQVRNDEQTWFFTEPHWSAQDRFWRRLISIPLAAYDGFLEAMWSFICAQKTPNLVLAGGRDKVVTRVPYYQQSGITSFAFVRERPDSGWHPYPEISVNLFTEYLCEHAVRRIIVDHEGRIKGFEDVNWPPQLAAALWCFIVDAYAEIVVSADEKGGPDDPRQNRPGLLKSHHAESETATVRAHFRKLPQGWRASEQQIQEAILAKGAPPEEGFTFVGEFQRGFPGVALSYREARDAWEVHRQLTPSLVINEDYVTALLDQIPSFG